MPKFLELALLISPLLLVVMISGCANSSTPNYYNPIPATPQQAYVRVTGYWESSGIELHSDPAIFHIHLDAVNTGNIDGKDVQADIILTYNLNTIASNTIYFGTVKEGETVHRDTILTGYLPGGFDKNNINMQVKEVRVSA